MTNFVTTCHKSIYDSGYRDSTLVVKKLFGFLDEFVTEDTKDNRELIAEGEEFIYKYLSDKFKTKYVPDIIDTARSYLTSESVLAHVGKHMGLKDLILSQVSSKIQYC